MDSFKNERWIIPFKKFSRLKDNFQVYGVVDIDRPVYGIYLLLNNCQEREIQNVTVYFYMISARYVPLNHFRLSSRLDKV